jgi:hypothetical protein
MDRVEHAFKAGYKSAWLQEHGHGDGGMSSEDKSLMEQAYKDYEVECNMLPRYKRRLI